ncbi:hypothetical protein K503DRAFT_855607 [Rhizopogon vinicolor AM-OR11-026]|uniref:RING-type domain-containing protein n=1 Tax=Rhizopogon vinicolor AM-OR11-026 TaxID=1314800 RepID=A0A1B7N5H4_9AGAM|nr:hypothetical protein K503DRAFT_855607 [Rhizopogon vinicolor AM-OR11-026]
MSSREPMWYCHECHAEMRPLMQPDPICASCHSSFVEKIEDLSDDPRGFQQHVPGGGFADDEMPPSLGGLLAALSGGPRPVSPISSRNPQGGTGGIRFELHSGPSGGATRTFILGGPNTLNRPRSPEHRDRDIPTMSEFMRRDNQSGPRQPGDITGPMMAQYLLALLGQGPTGRGVDPFTELFAGPEGGASSGRWGDYVFNQEALDQVITQLMENSAGRPVPATEEIISNLPREVLMERSPLLDKDCAVCKEQFQLATEDPEEQVVVILPCKHPFHQPCILPWLRSSGTCPVCRYSLIEQPQQPRPPGSSSGPSGGPGNRPTSPSSPSSASPRPRSPGSGRHGGGGGLFHSLFGGSASRTTGGSSSQARNSSSRGARRTGMSNESPGSTPFFPGRWDEEAD